MIPVEIELHNFLAYRAPPPLLLEGIHVAVTFDQEGRRYRVKRQHRAGKRAASVLELQTWDEDAAGWRSLSEAGIRETQLKIDGLLRLGYETFVNSAFLGQGPPRGVQTNN